MILLGRGIIFFCSFTRRVIISHSVFLAKVLKLKKVSFCSLWYLAIFHSFFCWHLGQARQYCWKSRSQNERLLGQNWQWLRFGLHHWWGHGITQKRKRLFRYDCWTVSSIFSLCHSVLNSAKKVSLLTKTIFYLSIYASAILSKAKKTRMRAKRLRFSKQVRLFWVLFKHCVFLNFFIKVCL